MDPSAALKAIRDRCFQLGKLCNKKDSIPSFEVTYMIDLVEGLDQWIANGGFLPDDWQSSAK